MGRAYIRIVIWRTPIVIRREAVALSRTRHSVVVNVLEVANAAAFYGGSDPRGKYLSRSRGDTSLHLASCIAASLC